MSERTTSGRTRTALLGSRLRQLRESLGLVLQDVADLFETGRNVVSQWETGAREPSYEYLLTLADYYGVTLDWLLGREGAEKDGPKVKQAKTELVGYLREQESALGGTTPGYRLRLAVEYLAMRGPEMFGSARLARQLLISPETLQQMVQEKSLPTGPVIQRFAQFVGLPEVWFYLPDPQLEDPMASYRDLVERFQAEGLTAETVEQRLWSSKRGRRRGPQENKE